MNLLAILIGAALATALSQQQAGRNAVINGDFEGGHGIDAPPFVRGGVLDGNYVGHVVDFPCHGGGGRCWVSSAHTVNGIGQPSTLTQLVQGVSSTGYHASFVVFFIDPTGAGGDPLPQVTLDVKDVSGVVLGTQTWTFAAQSLTWKVVNIPNVPNGLLGTFLEFSTLAGTDGIFLIDDVVFWPMQEDTCDRPYVLNLLTNTCTCPIDSVTDPYDICVACIEINCEPSDDYGCGVCYE